jgi:hypothetical protein
MIAANMIHEIHLIFQSTLGPTTKLQGEIDKLKNQKIEGKPNPCIGSHDTTIPNKTSTTIAQNVLTLNQDRDHRPFKRGQLATMAVWLFVKIHHQSIWTESFAIGSRMTWNIESGAIRTSMRTKSLPLEEITAWQILSHTIQIDMI